MDSKENLLERLYELMQDINYKINFGVDFTEEKQEADRSENNLIDSNSKIFNDEFIASHNWQSNPSLILPSDEFKSIIKEYRNKMMDSGISAAIL